MEIKNIVSAEKYTGKDGEKTSWNQVGKLFINGEKMFIKLNMFPNQIFSVFDQKKKEDKPEIDWDK